MSATGETMQRLRSFARDTAGGFAVWFAATIIPLALLVGAGVDMHRLQTYRSALQAASDAAALAAGRTYLEASEGDPNRVANARAAAEEAFSANVGATLAGLQNLVIDVRPDVDGTGELVVRVNADAPLAFAGLLGFDHVPVGATAATVVAARLEVALVLDTTGSMNSGGKLALMKSATAKLIDQLAAAAAQNPRSNPLKLALVPYSHTVRMPSGLGSAAWLDGRATGAGYWSAAAPAPDPVFDRFESYGPTGWAGCVESRPTPYDVTSAPASAGSPDSLYVPYWHPTNSANPNAGCEISPLIPLTDNIAAVSSAVDGLNAAGWTNIPMGLAWGWQALTPGSTIGAGVAGPVSQDLIKAVVLLTDGNNEIGGSGEYTGVGLLEQERLGVGASSTPAERTQALDTRLGQLCGNMKNAGVVIYTIRVEVAAGSDAAIKNCATRPQYYYDVRDADELPAVFARIGEDLIQLRLTR